MAIAADVRESDFDFGKEDEAVRALQARGVTGATRLLEHATPEAILASCKQWDRNPKAGTGLLVRMVQDGGVQAPSELKRSGSPFRSAFLDWVAEHPIGSVAASHMLLQRVRGDLEPTGRQRDYPGEEMCVGSMLVAEADYPVLVVECDRCALEFGVPAGQLGVLP